MLGRLVGFVVRNPMGILAAGAVALAWGAISVNAVLLQDGPHPAPFLGGGGTAAAPETVPAPKSTRRISAIELGSRADADTRQMMERMAALTRDLQVELSARNFYTGLVDGHFGPQTETAVRAYERAAGLAETGNATGALLEHIRLSALTAPPVPEPSPVRADATGSLSPNGDPVAALLDTAEPSNEAPVQQAIQSAVQATGDPRVEAVQTILADLGYAPGSIDGQFGPSTSKAIVGFEDDRGLPRTGEITPLLLKELTNVSGVPLG